MKPGALLAVLSTALLLHAQGPKPRNEPGPLAGLSLILGRPTAVSATLSVASATPIEACVTWGPQLAHRTAVRAVRPGEPTEFELTGLPAGARTRYQLLTRSSVAEAFRPGPEGSVQTQRRPGTPFTFALQGDSHPERSGRMYDAGLYARTLRAVAQESPDFYLTLGDDFSIERLIERQELSQPAVDAVYAHQRGFLGLVGAASSLFLVNGNHEQAARYLLDGTDTNAAVLAGRARTRFFPLPAPDTFYTGDAEPLPPVGLLRDYYAWTWGDALFVVIDPYWHSPVPVDNRAGERAPDRRAGGGSGAVQGDKPGTEGPRRGGKGNRDLWQPTLGEAQYRWLSRTLLESKSRWKFVFAHHVNGTGRGGVEEAGLYEWGGRDRRGEDRFRERRPGWSLPIHALFVKAGVTVFFQGHDHLYACQELDGVIYQSTPNPADPTGTAFNREAYRSGEIRPNSGFLRVTVAPDQVWVQYRQTTTGTEAHSYTVKPR